VINPYGAAEDRIQEAMDQCPVQCIHWQEDDQ
jgi:ferredoxin